MWGQSWGAALREPFLVGPWASADTSLALLLRITGCDGANEQAWPWVTVPLAAPRVLICSAENRLGAGQVPCQRVWGLCSLTAERQVGCAVGPGAGEQRPAQWDPLLQLGAESPAGTLCLWGGWGSAQQAQEPRVGDGRGRQGS